MPTAGVLGVTTLLGSNVNNSAGQSVVVGYKYGLFETTAFASVSESLSVLAQVARSAEALPVAARLRLLLGGRADFMIVTRKLSRVHTLSA